jgi:hypothetical protein
MSTIKVKEIKDDVIIQVPVNKHYYAMCKALLHNLFIIINEKGVSEESLKNILNKKYEEMTALEQSFYTVTILLAEIERQASINNFIEEKEIDTANINKALDNLDAKD